MRPPANLALSAARDRAAAGRTFSRFVRVAGPTVPGFSSTAGIKRFAAPAAAVRPPVDTRVALADRLRLERRGLGEAAIRESLARSASGDRSPRPSYAETVRAGRQGAAMTRPDSRRVREALDRGREDMARAAGDEPPSPLLKRGRLSVAEVERLAREYQARHGGDIRDARVAVERGAR